MGDRSSPDASRARAQAAIDLKRYVLALKEAGTAVAEEPENPVGHALLVIALSGLGRFKEGLAAAEAGLGHAPDSAALHRLRALMFNSLKRPKEALAAVDESIRLDPENAFAFQLRSMALETLKRRDEARIALEEAVRLDPDDADIRRLFGDRFLDSDPRAAEGHYRASLELDPNDAHTLNNLGLALQRQKRPLEAAAAFKAAVIMNPNLDVARENVHSAVGGLLTAGGGGLLAVSLVVRLLGKATKDVVLSSFVLVVALALLVFWLVRRSKDHLRVEADRKALQRLDPQIFEIYRRLEAEKKWFWRS